MPAPLSGIMVLDLSRILSGPFATMILGDLGAEVVKVERPVAGDTARGNGPFIDGVSSYFFSLNRGKKSVTLDLARPAGKLCLRRLAARADVLVENFVPGTMAKLGLAYPDLQQDNPRLVYAACSGYGQDGPMSTRPALDVIIQAAAGLMSITGEPGRQPVRCGVSIGDIAAGLYTCIGILTALQERQQSGKGQMLDISMMDSQVSILENAFARYFATGRVPGPLGSRHPVFTPFQSFGTADGNIVIALTGEQWPLFCAAIERVDLIDDPRFKDGYTRTQNYEVIEPILSQAIHGKTTAEWLAIMQPLGIPCGPINTLDEVAADPQIAHRRMIVEVPHPSLGKLKVINTPVKLSRTPGEVSQPAPELGEHTDRVLEDYLGLSPEEIARLRDSGAL